MGSGKTTVGRRLAAALDRHFVDADAALERDRRPDDRRDLRARRRGAPSATSSRTRSRSCSSTTSRASSPAVAASCCGRTTGPACGGATSRWCSSPPGPAFLTSRVEGKTHRPLLRGDEPALEILTRLHAERAPLYAEVADITVGGGAVPRPRGEAQAGAGRAHRRARGRARGAGDRVITVEVALGDRSYPVLIGSGVRAELASVLPASATRAAVVTQAGIGFDVDPGREHRVFEIADGEAAKTLGDRRAAVPRLGLVGPDPVGRGGAGGRGLRHRPRRLRRRELPPRRAGGARAHHAARHGRRRHRRQDRGEPARGQEPRRCLLAADRRAVRHRRPRHPAAARAAVRARRAGQVPLPGRHRPARPRPPGAHRGRRSDQGRRRGGRRARGSEPSGGGGPSSTTATPSPTRWRSRRPTSSATARPWRSVSPTPPPSPVGSVASTTRASRSTTVCWRPTSSTLRCPPGVDPDRLVPLMRPRQEGHRPVSPSCSTAPTGWRSCPAWPRPTSARALEELS